MFDCTNFCSHRFGSIGNHNLALSKRTYMFPFPFLTKNAATLFSHSAIRFFQLKVSVNSISYWMSAQHHSFFAVTVHQSLHLGESSPNYLPAKFAKCCFRRSTSALQIVSKLLVQKGHVWRYTFSHSLQSYPLGFRSCLSVMPFLVQKTNNVGQINTPAIALITHHTLFVQ